MSKIPLNLGLYGTLANCVCVCAWNCPFTERVWFTNWNCIQAQLQHLITTWRRLQNHIHVRQVMAVISKASASPNSMTCDLKMADTVVLVTQKHIYQKRTSGNSAGDMYRADRRTGITWNLLLGGSNNKHMLDAGGNRCWARHTFTDIPPQTHSTTTYSGAAAAFPKTITQWLGGGG